MALYAFCFARFQHIATISVDSADVLKVVRGEIAAPAALKRRIGMPDMAVCQDSAVVLFDGLTSFLLDLVLGACEADGVAAVLVMRGKALWRPRDEQATPETLFYLLQTDMAPLVQISIAYDADI